MDRGLLKDANEAIALCPRNKECTFCGKKNGIGESICFTCKRPLDRSIIEAEIEKQLKLQEEVIQLRKSVIELRKQISLKDNLQSFPDLTPDIDENQQRSG